MRRLLRPLLTRLRLLPLPQDVAWHCHHADIFGSVGDDKQLILWDVRRPPSQGEGRTPRGLGFRGWAARGASGVGKTIGSTERKTAMALPAVAVGAACGT